MNGAIADANLEGDDIAIVKSNSPIETGPPRGVSQRQTQVNTQVMISAAVIGHLTRAGSTGPASEEIVALPAFKS